MKLQKLRKRLLLEFAIVAVMAAILGGSAYFLSSMQDDYTNRKNTLDAEVSTVTNETNGLREKFIRIQKDQELYQLVMNLSNTDMLAHSTSLVDQKFRDYEDRYTLDKWEFTNQKSSLALDPALYQRKTSVIVARDGIFTFEAAKDEDIFSIMTEMQKDMPGAISFTSFKMNRETNVTDEALRTITQRGGFPLIKGSANLVWYAIEPTDPEELKRQNEANSKRTRRRR